MFKRMILTMVLLLGVTSFTYATEPPTTQPIRPVKPWWQFWATPEECRALQGQDRMRCVDRWMEMHYCDNKDIIPANPWITPGDDLGPGQGPGDYPSEPSPACPVVA